MRPRDRVGDQYACAEEGATDQAAIGSAPAVLVLKTGHDRAKPGEHRQSPVSASGYTKDDPNDRSERERHKAAEHYLDWPGPISKQRWCVHPIFFPRACGFPTSRR